MTTLYSIITEYLETHKKSTETWLLNRFKEYMDKNHKNIHVEKVKEDALKGIDYFECFLDSLSISETSKNNHRSRLKRFQQFIGLSEVKPKKKRNPENDQAVILDLKKELTKRDKQLADKDVAISKHDETIEGQNQTIEEQKAEIKTLTEGRTEECSKCPKIVPLNETIKLTEATLVKERKDNKTTNDELESKQGEIASLETDNEYLKSAMKEQSHDKLLEENQYLKVQLGQKDAEIESKEKRIGEVEKLIETEIKQKGEIVSRISKMVRDFKAYMPSKNERCDQCVNNFSIEEYRRNAFKSVTNLEDYIKGLCQDT